ncbi:RNA polymerase sigma-70 factor [Pedobacter rhizosphaerae]|uniref:RNA polymerase sigma-70 factor, ECF subfamily n=1 Tax=Pedobacter rhizosphaerae TaxID=390241 RepID=A0A1H9SSJ2_9SPHI|nr:RNA polymerase sigma-70 factor [Pedobacter rhizosphaerae]SER87824.1 RNA polymerase sigma-70 factor, ECF subfamily [Pedobacter rhizosphaerae]
MKDYSGYTDQGLLMAMRSGDSAAFTEIHHRYYPILYAHASRRLSDRDDVNDLLQELFLYLWNNRMQEFSGHLSGYLYTSVRNRIINVYRSKKIRSDYMDSLQNFLEQNQQPIADNLVREKELTLIIEREISALPPQMRLVFEMSRNLHKSHQEIADELSISPLTVKKQIYNSLKILRSKLGPHFHAFFI